MKRMALAVCCLFLTTGFGSGERLFAPSAELWERWQAHDPASTRSVDHGAWNALLQRHVVVSGNGANLVRYGAFGAADRDGLARYIAALSAVPISKFNRTEQLAYWFNLYNALTVQVVLEHYPVDSIRDIDISPGLFADGPWDVALVSVEGQPLTLNDIEHRIIRPIWRDPRIHYAVNCAAIGCPDLAPTAYRGAGLDARLTAAAKAYINDGRGVTLEHGGATVSKIYDWYLEDFGNSEAGVLEHLKRYAEPALRQHLENLGALRGVAYDWSLNGAP